MTSDWVCYVDHLEVRTEHQRQGKGTRLLKMAEEHLSKCGCKEVWLHATKSSRGFYHKNGYHRVIFSYGGEMEKSLVVRAPTLWERIAASTPDWLPWVAPKNVAFADL